MGFHDLHCFLPAPHPTRRRPVALVVCLLAPIICLAQSVQAAPRPAAGVKRGEHLAREVCSACHTVASDQEFPPLLVHPAPPFEEIANRPTTTEESLRRFISSTHWDTERLPMTMPNPMLEPAQIKDVARYILSLRKP